MPAISIVTSDTYVELLMAVAKLVLLIAPQMFQVSKIANTVSVSIRHGSKV
jgi:hypothetical protein